VTDAADGSRTGATLRPQKRSFSIRGHRTSVSLEAPFWEALKEAASEEGLSLAALVAEIDAGRGAANLSSAIRVFLLARWRDRAARARPAPECA
jgi:predicted DNA-binding ribbon-helix-helix protein